MARRIVMDHTGDTRHQFDPGDAGTVDRDFRLDPGSIISGALRMASIKSSGKPRSRN